MTETPPADRLCAHCGEPEREHWAVNFSDGPHVGGSTLICPTAVFTPKRKSKRP